LFYYIGLEAGSQKLEVIEVLKITDALSSSFYSQGGYLK
jgi:hypothetical protein